MTTTSPSTLNKSWILLVAGMMNEVYCFGAILSQEQHLGILFLIECDIWFFSESNVSTPQWLVVHCIMFLTWLIWLTHQAVLPSHRFVPQQPSSFRFGVSSPNGSRCMNVRRAGCAVCHYCPHRNVPPHDRNRTQDVVGKSINRKRKGNKRNLRQSRAARRLLHVGDTLHVWGIMWRRPARLYPARPVWGGASRVTLTSKRN